MFKNWTRAWLIVSTHLWGASPEVRRDRILIAQVVCGLFVLVYPALWITFGVKGGFLWLLQLCFPTPTLGSFFVIYTGVPLLGGLVGLCLSVFVAATAMAINARLTDDSPFLGRLYGKLLHRWGAEATIDNMPESNNPKELLAWARCLLVPRMRQGCTSILSRQLGSKANCQRAKDLRVALIKRLGEAFPANNDHPPRVLREYIHMAEELGPAEPSPSLKPG